MKKIIYILLGVIVVVIVFFVVVRLFSNNVPAGTGAPTSTTTGTLPSVQNQSSTGVPNYNPSVSGGNTGSTATPGSPLKFGIISNELVSNYFVDAQNNVFLVEPNGEIAEVTNSQVSYLSTTQVTNLITGGFSYDGKNALVNFGTSTKPQTSVFNITTKVWTPLPLGILSPTWSPSDERIAYLTAATGTETLATLDLTKTTNKPVSLLTLHANDLMLQWLNKNQIILSDKPSAFADGSMWLYDLTRGTLTSIVSDEAGIEAIWGSQASPALSMGLVFSTTASERGGGLELMNLSSSTSQKITFLTLPSKCVFNVQTSTTATAVASTSSPIASDPYLALYCGVPRDQSSLTYDRLPDDYNEMSLFTSDDIYMINASSGSINDLYANSSENLDVSDPKVYGGTLFFINRYDQKLYALSLGQ